MYFFVLWNYSCVPKKITLKLCKIVIFLVLERVLVYYAVVAKFSICVM